MINKFDKKKMVLIVIIFLLIAALISTGVFFVVKHNEKITPTVTNVVNDTAVKGIDTSNTTKTPVKVVVKKPVVKPIVTTPPVKVAPKPIPVVPAPKPVPTSVCVASFNSQFIVLINNYRKSKGLPVLTISSKLNTSACGHSAWMSKNSTLSHTGANGSTPWDRCKLAGTTCSGEIVAMNSDPSAQNLFNQWKNSAPHNAIMLGKYTQIGIGLYGMYGTADFR